MELVTEVEVELDALSKQLGKKLYKEIKTFQEEHWSTSSADILQELDEDYYQKMRSVVPEGEYIPTFEEFRQFAQSEDYDEIRQVQSKVALEGKLAQLLEITTRQPDISFHKLMEELE